MANWYEEKRFSPEDLYSIVFIELMGFWQFPTKLFAQYIYLNLINNSNVIICVHVMTASSLPRQSQLAV